MSSVITVSQPNYTVTVTGETTVTVDNTTTLTVATVGIAGPTGATGATGPAGPTDAGYQPGQPTSSSAVTVYVSATGNDTTGDGSVGSPYLTIRKAEQKIAEFPISSANVVNIGLGSFDFSGFHGINGVSYVGTMVDGSTVTISSISLSGSDITMVVTGATATLNSLVGQYLKHSAGLYSCIRSNTATSAGNTTIVACLNNTNAAATLPIVTSTAIIQASGTFLTGGPSFRGGSITVQDCTPTGGASILWGTSPATANTWRRINFAQIGGVNSEGGVTNLETCYVGSLGGSLRGIGRVRQGTLYLKAGTILSGVNAGANNFFVVCRGSTVDIAGPIGVDSLAGIRFEASRFVVTEFPGSWNVIGWGSTCTKGFVVDLGASGSSTASNLLLPLMTGAITGNWCVEARRRAYVELTTGSTVTTSLGTNTVSCDSTNSYPNHQDGALIVGGSIDYRVVNSILYASASGSDTNDGLSAGAPITLATALARAPKNWSGINQIYLAAGTYTVSSALLIRAGHAAGPSSEPLTLIGTAVNSGLGSRTSTTIATMTVTDSTLSMTTNQYEGYNLRFTSGAQSGSVFTVQSNTATAFTVCAVANLTSTAGATFVIEAPGSIINHVGIRIVDNPVCTMNMEFNSTAAFVVESSGIWFNEQCKKSGTGLITMATGGYIRTGGLKVALGTGPGLAAVGTSNTVMPLWITGGTTSISRKSMVNGAFFIRNTASAISMAGQSVLNFLFLDTNGGIDVSQNSGLFCVAGGNNKVSKSTGTGIGISLDSNSFCEFGKLDLTGCTGDAIRVNGNSYFKVGAFATLTGGTNTGYGVRLMGGGRFTATATGVTVTGMAGDFKVGGLAAGTWAGLLTGTASSDSGVAARGEFIEKQ